jgi:hypothetical protein
METEVLKDTTDIPDLALDFTAMVISSLGAVKAVSNQSDSFPSRHWYQALTAGAAVIVLCLLYSSQLFNHSSPVKIADNDNYIRQPALSTSGADNLAPTSIGPVPPVPAVSPTLGSSPAVISAVHMSQPSLPVSDNQQLSSIQPPNAIAPATIAPAALQGAAQEPTAGSTAVAGSSALIPQNLPTRFQLVEVDIFNGHETVYNYSSQDEQEKLQISVVPYSENTEKVLPSTRIYQVGDKKISVTFSGNLPPEEFQLLANTIQFTAAGM